MNEIEKNPFFSRRFMPEIHLRQPVVLNKPGFTYSAWGPFTKNKKEYKDLTKNKIHDIFIKMD